MEKKDIRKKKKNLRNIKKKYFKLEFYLHRTQLVDSSPIQAKLNRNILLLNKVHILHQTMFLPPPPPRCFKIPICYLARLLFALSFKLIFCNHSGTLISELLNFGSKFEQKMPI